MYFVTAVAANLVYATRWGEPFLMAVGYSTEFLTFSGLFTPGFFALLLMPFVVTPIVVAITYRAAKHLEKPLSGIPEIGRPEFLVATVALVGYLALTFWKADVLSLLAQGNNMASSVEARFQILARLGTGGLIALHSVLWFLSIYALVKSLRSKQVFWIAAFLGTFVIVSTMLTMLNMKWPVLVYFAAVLVAVFIYSSKPYFALVVGVLLLAGAYVGVSSFVFRTGSMISFEEMAPVITPSLAEAEPGEGLGEAEGSNLPSSAPPTATMSAEALAEQRVVEGEKAFHQSPALLLLSPLNRMAVAVPYYYHVFTEEGPICGDIFWRRHPPCVPTYEIYTRIFPSDEQFAGRGTSPAAVHISGYAHGGFPVATATLILASIILGFYSAFPLGTSSTLGALFVAGVTAGYHFSQLPIDGPIIYDHGILYSTIVAGLLALATAVRKAIARRARLVPPPS